MLDEIRERQRGVVTRRQAAATGLTLAAIRARLTGGDWQKVFPAVYATFSGPVPRPALLWAVVLRAGPGAALSHHTAAELAGLTDLRSDPIDVTVPVTRRVRPIPGVRVHLAGRLASRTHPSRRPPQTRIEDTVLDLSQVAGRAADAAAWVTKACARRLTTPDRIAAALSLRAEGPLACGTHGRLRRRVHRMSISAGVQLSSPGRTGPRAAARGSAASRDDREPAQL